MTQLCRDLVSFVDGELAPEQADAFRAHLQSCEACRTGVLEAMQLSVRLGALTPPERAKAISTDPDKPPPALRLARPSSHVPPTWKPRLPHWIAVAVAAVALFVLWRSDGPRDGTLNAFAGQEARPYDVRFAYGDAARYRPRNEMRGPTGSRKPISHTILAELEKRDRHALAIAAAWNADLTDAAAQLRPLAPTPAVLSDRTAIDLLTTQSGNIESVLARLEALRSSNDPAVARAARWNYAILLSRLELPLGAARAFEAIAAEHEPGWADEARDLARREARQGNDARTTWQHANKAGQALVTAGTPVPAELIKAVPGVLRTYFYNAVRTAPTPERVRALAAMAAELDRLGDRRILGDYVERVAKADFRRRAPFADAYARLLDSKPVSARERAELTTPTASGDVIDIVMGAMVQLDAVADHLAEFREMAKQNGDPWFEILQAQVGAAADQRRNDWLGAEEQLKAAEKLCNPAFTYQCLVVAHDLGMLYQTLHRVPDAIAVVNAAIGRARSAGEWAKARQLLTRLADIERFHASTATARAYASEVLLMADACDYQSVANRVLTGAALLDGNGRSARYHFEAAQRCSEHLLTRANYLADIGRLDPRPDDLARLQGWLGTLRAGGKLTPAERAFADEIEGRLLVQYDRAAGTALLERAITAADALPRDVAAQKERAGAYDMLIADAARQGDHARVLALIAQDLRLPPPGPCTVGMVVQSEGSVVVVRSRDGTDRAAVETRRPLRGAPNVPDELASRLVGCAHVQVLARAAVQGQPRVLPANLPWSYATGARRADPPRGPASTEAHALVVADVLPPPDLGLPRLSASARQSDHPAGTRALTGAAATPSSVLAAMREANEIQFHTHALVNMGVSDASYLVLSREPDGRHALTAEAIRGAELRGRPIVVLAACHSAQGAQYEHAPWSLPHAFLAIGARAVLAAGTAIPDADAGPFFARVLDRVRAGTDPAVALRDERVATGGSNPSSWIGDVILFE